MDIVKGYCWLLHIPRYNILKPYQNYECVYIEQKDKAENSDLENTV